MTHCFCEQQYEKLGVKALEIVFSDGVKHCIDWFPTYFMQGYINFALAFIISLINLALQYVLKEVRIPGVNKQIELTSITFIIFISQYVNTAIMFMLAYHSFLQNPELRKQNDERHLFVGPFDEFTVRWYLVVGTPIIMAVAMMIFFPHLRVIGQTIKMSYRRCRDRGSMCNFNKRYTKQLTQEDYESLYTGPIFLIEVRLA